LGHGGLGKPNLSLGESKSPPALPPSRPGGGQTGHGSFTDQITLAVLLIDASSVFARSTTFSFRSRSARRNTPPSILSNITRAASVRLASISLAKTTRVANRRERNADSGNTGRRGSLTLQGNESELIKARRSAWNESWKLHLRIGDSWHVQFCGPHGTHAARLRIRCRPKRGERHFSYLSLTRVRSPGRTLGPIGLTRRCFHNVRNWYAAPLPIPRSLSAMRGKGAQSSNLETVRRHRRSPAAASPSSRILKWLRDLRTQRE
jgi:hypothetical protein